MTTSPVSRNEPPCANPCRGAYLFSNGVKGDRADSTKILLVANCPTGRLRQGGLFHSSHKTALLNSVTGHALQEILKETGLTLEHVYFTNAFQCLLQGNRIPSRGEYESCRNVLRGQILEFQPRKIVSFGNKAYESLLPEIAAKKSFMENLWLEFDYQGNVSCPVFISHHPSMLHTIASKDRFEHYAALADFIRR